MIHLPMKTSDKQAPKQDYEWFKTPYGDYRIEESRWGTFNTFDRDGKGLITGLHCDSTKHATEFHLREVIAVANEKSKLSKSQAHK